MKLTSSQRLIVISLTRGPRTFDEIRSFANTNPLYTYRAMPDLMKADLLFRLPNDSEGRAVYALNYDSIDVKRVLNSIQHLIAA